MSSRTSDRCFSALFGFIGAGLFWVMAPGKPVIAQVGGATPAFVRVQGSSPGTAQAGHSNITGTNTAGNFKGDGLGLTNLDAGNVSTGTLADGRLSSEIARKSLNNTWSGVNNFTSATNSFAGDGTLLGKLNASSLSMGKVPDSRLTVGGDIGSNLSSATVQGIQNVPVDSVLPSFDEVLRFDGTKWTPAPDGFTLPAFFQYGDGAALLEIRHNGTGRAFQGRSTGTAILGFNGTGSDFQNLSGVCGSTSSVGGTGVAGIANSTVNTAGRFENQSQLVTICNGTYAIRTNGFLWKQYGSSGESAAMPVAYGCVNSAGTIAGGTGNFTVTKIGVGIYDIEITGETYSSSNCSASVTPVNSANPRYATTTNNSGVLRVVMWNSGGTNSDNQFQFTVYKVSPTGLG